MSVIKALASPSLRSLATQRTGAAMFTTSVRSCDVFKEKERGDESIHFRKEDERLLTQLLHKVKAAAEKVNPEAAKETAKEELHKIKSIIDKYKISDEDAKGLLQWKYSH